MFSRRIAAFGSSSSSSSCQGQTPWSLYQIIKLPNTGPRGWGRAFQGLTTVPTLDRVLLESRNCNDGQDVGSLCLQLVCRCTFLTLAGKVCYDIKMVVSETCHAINQDSVAHPAHFHMRHYKEMLWSE